MIDESVRQGLLASDRALVAAAARKLGEQILGLVSGDERATLLGQAIEALDGARGLDGRERDMRARSILALAVVREDHDALGRFARTARHADPAVKNAVRASLPPNLRGEYGAAAEDGRVAPPAMPVNTPPASRAEQLPDETNRVVLLLGNESEHASNRNLLNNRGFSPILREGPDELGLMAATACGLVVASSFWANLSADDHAGVLQQICELSSILFLHIDTNLLEPAAAAALSNILHRAHTEEPSALRVRSTAGCTLSESDIPGLARAGLLIESADHVRLHPAGLAPAEETLLRAAALRRIHTETGSASELERIQLRFLDGGRSRARLAVLEPDDGGAPFVAKLDDAGRLRDEMARYRAHIARWEARTQPELHFHGGCAAIVFSLVDDASDGNRPAPMLESRMEAVLAADLSGSESPLAEHVATAVARAVDRLAKLNAKRVADAPTPLVGWMAGVPELRALAQRGITWDMRDSAGHPIDLIRAAERAAARIDRLDGLARSHGDVHLRNILLRDDREPFFIDYAQSGGLHPCYDLVRLDVALSPYVLVLEGPREMADVFHSLLVEGRPAETIASSHPLSARPQANRIAFNATALVRQACMTLLESYDGDVQDYLAMQVAISSFALRRTNLQSGAIHARLASLAAHVR